MTTRRLEDDRLGQYELVTKLGEGGMGIVYLARQTVPARQVALKVAKPEILLDPLNRARFLQEANAVAKLQHPHIVPIYEVGEAALLGQQTPYIAMAYIEGLTLRDYLSQNGALPLRETTEIIRQVGMALDHAHHNAIIHRDIKPSNILLDKNRLAYLMDFGLARDVNVASGLTMAGALVGTPEYMSPEQAEGAKVIGPPSDIYALGLVLYEMLTGKLPFQGETPLSIITSRLTRQPIPPRSFMSSLPPVVEDILMRTLARRPEHRFHSAAELVQALQAAEATPTANATYQGQVPTVRTDATLAATPAPTYEMPKTMVLPSNAPIQPLPAPPQTYGSMPSALPGGTLPPVGPPPPLGAGGVPPGGWGTPPPPPPQRANRGRLFLGLGIGLFVFLLLLGGGVVGRNVIVSQQATATAIAGATATAVADAATATAASEATATAVAKAATATASAVAAVATRTAVAQATAAPRQTATAVAAATNTAVAATSTALASVPPAEGWYGRTIFGPRQGELLYNADKIVAVTANIAQADFVADVRMFNPPTAKWDYGIQFRSTSTKEYRLIFASTKKWKLTLYDGNASGADRFTTVDSGDVSRLNLRTGAYNDLRVAAITDVGLVYVNNVFVTQLDLSAHRGAGDVAAAAWMFTDSGEPGVITNFRDFNIWKISTVSIADGQIAHQPDNTSIETKRLREDARDFLIIAGFTNPYAVSADQGWDYGVAFRRTAKAQHFITLDSSGKWLHWLRTIVNGKVDDKIVTQGTISNLDLAANGGNKLVVFANGPTGRLYINGKFVSELDLSGALDSGSLDLFTGFSKGHEFSGSSTGYNSIDVYLSE